MDVKKILVIEDDRDIAEILSIYLGHVGYDIAVATCGEEALSNLAQTEFDLIICDIMLPDMEGTFIIKELRKHSNIPVIFLSSKKENEDILNGFHLGGDDYVTKPFDPDILVARVQAQLKRSVKASNKEEHSSEVWKDAHLELHFDSMDVKRNGQPVSLSTKERQLLFHLAKHPNQVFTVNQLYDLIWGLDGLSDTRTVMVHIHHLRKKLEIEASDPSYIMTVRGIGYKFNTK
ncbi:response regulator transcription factor [Bacillus sp. JCM 19034]|uniref:response regulator transcription factor n=1 Tax=Bacillus sp. JCM 19034 TaxID=1481928 RepID=UPI0007860238|nr:response regulator transcription factor [Bacillus sp. JCM 19034]